MLKTWLPRKKATKQQILSLVGTLQHASKVVRPGRTIVSRMYTAADKLRKMHYITRLNAACHSDLFWWRIFLQSCNGILCHPALSTPPNLSAQTGASGTWECAAALSSLWCHWQWPPKWSSVGIMAKELILIILTCVAWGTQLSKHHINFQCDNLSLVAVINKGSAKDQFVMHLFRCLWFLWHATYDIYITATHLSGAINVTADHLSCSKLAFQSTPSLS